VRADGSAVAPAALGLAPAHQPRVGLGRRHEGPISRASRRATICPRRVPLKVASSFASPRRHCPGSTAWLNGSAAPVTRREGARTETTARTVASGGSRGGHGELTVPLVQPPSERSEQTEPWSTDLEEQLVGEPGAAPYGESEARVGDDLDVFRPGLCHAEFAAIARETALACPACWSCEWVGELVTPKPRRATDSLKPSRIWTGGWARSPPCSKTPRPTSWPSTRSRLATGASCARRMKVSRPARHRVPACGVVALGCAVGVVDPRAKRRFWD
jgi:hypothetical protein